MGIVGPGRHAGDGGCHVEAGGIGIEARLEHGHGVDGLAVAQAVAGGGHRQFRQDAEKLRGEPAAGEVLPDDLGERLGDRHAGEGGRSDFAAVEKEPAAEGQGPFGRDLAGSNVEIGDARTVENDVRGDIAPQGLGRIVEKRLSDPRRRAEGGHPETVDGDQDGVVGDEIAAGGDPGGAEGALAGLVGVGDDAYDAAVAAQADWLMDNVTPDFSA